MVLDGQAMSSMRLLHVATVADDQGISSVRLLHVAMGVDVE